MDWGGEPLVEELPGNAPPEGLSGVRGWFIGVFASGRFFAAFAVIGAFLAAVTLYIYGAFVVIATIWETVVRREVNIDGAKRLQVAFVELTDVFLLGTVLVIVSFGLYQLFLDPGLPVPNWLRIDDLDQLTMKVMEVVGLLLGVTFLAFAVEFRFQATVIELGIASAAVILALCALLLVSHRVRGDIERRQTDTGQRANDGPGGAPPRPPRR
jgi:uncharacterized membrane protein YqhA